MKVLIISHNPMSTKHSIGKTLMSLFSSFNKEEMCQLYIHTGLPEVEICSSFFQVTDKEVLQGFFSRNVRGKVVRAFLKKEENKEGLKSYRKLYNSKRNHEPHREILRDLMWKLSPWYNQKLKSWIEEQKPTCIFVAIGSSTFLYDMALKISKDYNLPIYTYVCDDFYSLKTPKTILGPLWKKLIVLKTKKLMQNTEVIVTICKELSDFYRKEFKRRAITLMTGTNFEIVKNKKINEKVKKIRYFGKLSINRYKSIAEICKALDEINIKMKEKYFVEIFCGKIDKEILEEFKNTNSVKFYDFISGEEFKQEFFSSDILVHIEAFDEISVDRVKYSVSTKIADTLASGIPLLAYGPDSVASIQHLKREKAGIIITNKEELQDALKDILENQEKRKKVSIEEIKTADTYHNPLKISELLYNLLKE